MILSPSDIHFLQDVTSKGLLDPDSRAMQELSARFLESRERIPKVQVAERNGFWFALNNGYLHILRDLERRGHCAKVRVEVVPLTKVPKNVQKGMVVGSQAVTDANPGNNDHECYRITGQGYCRVPSACLATNSPLAALAAETDDTSSYTSTDYSDYDDDEDEDDISDSEYEDELECVVCEQGFDSPRLLLQHQHRKRHFGCAVCGAQFRDLPSLLEHRDGLEHWSQDEGNTYESDFYDEDEDEDEEEDGVDVPQEGRPEEVERLLWMLLHM